jgi:thiamine biosynthesis lipoprotein
MRLDLGGIAKGYAGDEAIRVLREHGIRAAFFEAGGDIVVSGAPPGTPGWDVAVVRKLDGEAEMHHIKHCGVSTSGDAEQFVEIGGKRYSHVVDPRTGIGLTARYEATVIAPNGITSDALSTAACVLGAEGYQFVKSYPCTQVFIGRGPSAR